MGASGSSVQPNSYTLVAQGGGPGQLRPEEAAKILKVSSDGTSEVLADTLAFEEANNPGGEPGPDGIDSNPWRLAKGPDGAVYISDAGANDVLKMVESTGELSLYAVFDMLGDSQPIPTGLAFANDVLYVALLGPMFSTEPMAEIRRLDDLNGDGDALDEGENTELIGGLSTLTDVAIGPYGNLYFVEMFPGTLSRLDPTCWSADAPCTVDDRHVVATGLTAATAMTHDDNFDLLVATGPVNPDGPSLQTDRVVRVPFSVIGPEPPITETPGTPTATPSDTPGAGTPTSTPTAANGEQLFLPILYNGFGE
jgi:hypothetical protein